jgi:DNA invertase Pin-like site-specific DNA recombinase
MSKPKRQRAAIYTRKSTEAGLEQDFNSLDAQREACAAFIKSQAQEGWQLLAQHYDDGGISGASLERPALQQLLSDIEADTVDIVVVYKVDRLTRSLTDFAKLVELFDRFAVSFVSVTQQFNTTSSMGRLTLNVLLSFAQFEREVTAERIRDKIAASKAQGIWMGGPVPLGYDLGDRRLIVNPAEATLVTKIFQSYLELGSVRALKASLDRQGLVTKVRHQKVGKITGGGPFSRGHLYRLLANPIYIGKLAHKDRIHDGRHEAIVDPELWEKVQSRLKANTHGYNRTTAQHPSLLAGRLTTSDGHKLIPSHAVKHGKRYRYYIAQRLIQDDGVGTKGERYAAPEVEKAAIAILQRFLDSPTEIIAGLPLEDTSPSSIKRLTWHAKAISRALRDPHEALRIIPQILCAVIIHSSELDLILHRQTLAQFLDVDITAEDPTYLITSPCKLARRGQELKFLLPLQDDPQQYSNRDATLIRAIAKAHLWWQWIKNGEVQSLQEIAEREGLDKPQVTRRVRLAFLSPKLVGRILDGLQPAGLSLKTLTREIDLPLDWTAQEELFASLV